VEGGEKKGRGRWFISNKQGKGEREGGRVSVLPEEKKRKKLANKKNLKASSFNPNRGPMQLSAQKKERGAKAVADDRRIQNRAEREKGKQTQIAQLTFQQKSSSHWETKKELDLRT